MQRKSLEGLAAGAHCDTRGGCHQKCGVLLSVATRAATAGVLFIEYRAPFGSPELRAVSRTTLLDSLGCVRLVLRTKTQRRLVTFRGAEGSS
jgi:hypothetical protein